MSCPTCSTQLLPPGKACVACGEVSPALTPSIAGMGLPWTRGTGLVNPYAPPRSTIHPVQAASLTAAKPRPWVRHWARLVDLSLFSNVVGLALGAIDPAWLGGPYADLLFWLSVLFTWIFAESLLLSTVGTTPGKWLLRTRLTSASGKAPDFPSALSRSFKVWWRGMGIGIPVAYLVTMSVAYDRLRNNGTTSWDREGGFTVVHGPVGPVRFLVAALLLIGDRALIIWSNT